MRFVPNSDEGGGGAVTIPPPRRAPHRWRLAAVVLAGALLALAALVGVRSAWAPDDARQVEAQAREYVALALALGRIEPDAVDGYFGPPGLAPPADRPPPTLAEVRSRAVALLGAVEQGGGARRAALVERVRQLVRVIDSTQASAPARFDAEARRLYGLAIGPIDASAGRAALAAIDRLLPGAGPLPARVAAFRARLTVPPARREAVFARALAECRRRTAAHWPLPRDERVELRWTANVPAAWHHYLGRDASRLDVNPDAVAFVGAAIDTACHEAYPGHHAQFVAMDRAAGGALPIERRVVLLRSPETVLREGAANEGVRLAFPLADRISFMRDVLYPLAGLPPAEAERDARVHALLGRLEPVSLPILAAYRDGALPFDAAAAALRERALVASPEALLRFTDRYGALVTGYTVARDRVAAQVDARAARCRCDRWSVLRAIVSGPDLSALSPAARPDQGS